MIGISLAAILLMAARAFPQVVPKTDAVLCYPDSQKTRRNSLAFLFVADNFFDGHRPFIQSLRLPTIGGEYGRTLNRNWSLHASVRYCYRDHYYALKPPLEIGDITQRSIIFGDLSFHRKLMTWDSGALAAFAGLGVRVGGEFMYVGQYGFEPLTDKYYLTDPGVVVGFRASQELLRRFSISLETKYAYYYWTDPHYYLYAYDLPNRPTKNLFAIQAGIHFNF